MKIEYEPKHDIVNIEFLEDVPIEESIEYDDGIIIDYSKDKKIVSMEILDASKRIKEHPLETIQFSVVREKIAMSV